MPRTEAIRSTSAPLKVAVFLPSLAGGGAERVTLALAEGLHGAGCTVDLLVGTTAGALQHSVPAGVELHDLAAGRTIFAAIKLRRFLRAQRPDVLIAAIVHANIIAAVVARLVRPRCRVIVMHHNTTSLSTRNTDHRRDRLMPMLCGLTYRLADRVIAVSHGVAADLVTSSHLPASRIKVISNPIDYDVIRSRAEQQLDPSTAPAGEDPLVIAVGRLEPQKGFDVLIRAAAQAKRPWRLAILGAGPLRDDLLQLAATLGIGDRVTLPGFVDNPYPYFRAAQVFALSSRFEGLPTVLVESLAFPMRIVATDCPSGPAQILDEVEGAELVPVEDVAALSTAIDRAVDAGVITGSRPQWRLYEAARVMPLMMREVRDAAR